MSMPNVGGKVVFGNGSERAFREVCAEQISLLGNIERAEEHGF